MCPRTTHRGTGAGTGMESSAFGISFDFLCHDLILALSTLAHPCPQHLDGDSAKC